VLQSNDTSQEREQPWRAVLCFHGVGNGWTPRPHFTSTSRGITYTNASGFMMLLLYNMQKRNYLIREYGFVVNIKSNFADVTEKCVIESTTNNLLSTLI
jgi:hypothetical protein